MVYRPLPRPIGHIVHVRAGLCSELQSYEDLAPQKIVLIEADKQQATKLKTVLNQKNIDILSFAVTNKKIATDPKHLLNSLFNENQCLTEHVCLTKCNDNCI